MKISDTSLFKQKNFINGEWSIERNGKVFDIINPSDLSKIGTMPDSSDYEANLAIVAANNAWKSWRKYTNKERAIIIRSMKI